MQPLVRCDPRLAARRPAAGRGAAPHATIRTPDAFGRLNRMAECKIGCRAGLKTPSHVHMIRATTQLPSSTLFLSWCRRCMTHATARRRRSSCIGARVRSLLCPTYGTTRRRPEGRAPLALSPPCSSRSSQRRPAFTGSRSLRAMRRRPGRRAHRPHAPPPPCWQTSIRQCASTRKKARGSSASMSIFVSRPSLDSSTAAGQSERASSPS